MLTISRKMFRAQGNGILWSIIALSTLLLGGCDGDLEHAHDSPESLAEAVLEALEDNDKEALEALWVTREEHRELLWNQLPERNTFPFEYVRQLNEMNTRKGINNIIRRYGGQKFELVSLEFMEPSESYEGFSVHFGPKLTVRRSADGLEGELPILDVVLEWDGRWKLMNYEDR